MFSLSLNSSHIKVTVVACSIPQHIIRGNVCWAYKCSWCLRNLQYWHHVLLLVSPGGNFVMLASLCAFEKPNLENGSPERWHQNIRHICSSQYSKPYGLVLKMTYNVNVINLFHFDMDCNTPMENGLLHTQANQGRKPVMLFDTAFMQACLRI